jgi:hypothetical protein
VAELLPSYIKEGLAHGFPDFFSLSCLWHSVVTKSRRFGNKIYLFTSIHVWQWRIYYGLFGPWSPFGLAGMVQPKMGCTCVMFVWITYKGTTYIIDNSCGILAA